MSKKSKNKASLNQQIQDMKVKKNAFIIAALFWIGTSLFIYSQDEGFSDVYSWKPFVFFIVGPIVSAYVFENILFSLQKIIEKFVISLFAKSRPHLIGPIVSTFFFILLVGAFLTIFEFSKLVQLVLN